MKQQQARALLAQIAADFAPSQVRVSLNDRHADPVRDRGYRVDVLLVPGQRRASLNYLYQWDDLVLAWSLFLAREVAV